MKENTIARILQVIGWLQLVATIIITLSIENTANTFIFSCIASFIVCMIFQGFSEIIELLYINGKKQETIIDYLYLNNANQEELIKLINAGADSKNKSSADFSLDASNK